MTGLEVDRVTVERAGFTLGPVSVDVPDGRATVLLGPSGAGKTTLLRAAAGFLPLAGGSVRLAGVPIDGLPPERRGFGFVPANLGLFPDRRVRQNVRYPIALRGDSDVAGRTEHWLERFGLGALADRFPRELSSGERQRVAMARALASGPKALLWDEPLAALDVESRDELLRLLADLLETERLPLLLVTHDPSTAFALASRLVVLEGGTVRFDGPPERLARSTLDRFSARFLGHANLLDPEELARAGPDDVARALRAASGPGGVVVPNDAIAWTAAPPSAANARVQSVRWSTGGWTVTIRLGALVLHRTVPGEVPPVRVGDSVVLTLDPAALKPLVVFPSASSA